MCVIGTYVCVCPISSEASQLFLIWSVSKLWKPKVFSFNKDWLNNFWQAMCTRFVWYLWLFEEFPKVCHSLVSVSLYLFLYHSVLLVFWDGQIKYANADIRMTHLVHVWWGFCSESYKNGNARSLSLELLTNDFCDPIFRMVLGDINRGGRNERECLGCPRRPPLVFVVVGCNQRYTFPPHILPHHQRCTFGMIGRVANMIPMFIVMWHVLRSYCDYANEVCFAVLRYPSRIIIHLYLNISQELNMSYHMSGMAKVDWTAFYVARWLSGSVFDTNDVWFQLVFGCLLWNWFHAQQFFFGIATFLWLFGKKKCCEFLAICMSMHSTDFVWFRGNSQLRNQRVW